MNELSNPPIPGGEDIAALNAALSRPAPDGDRYLTDIAQRTTSDQVMLAARYGEGVTATAFQRQALKCHK